MRTGLRVIPAVLVLVILLAGGSAFAYLSTPRVGGLNDSGPAAAMVTSIFTNPAAIGLMKGNHFFFDANGTYFRAAFKRSGTDTENGGSWDSAGFGRLMPVPFIGFTTKLGTDWFTLGAAAYVPFGREATWPRNGSQRYELTDLNAKDYTLTPAFSLRFHKMFYIGAGFNLQYVTMLTERSYDLAPEFYTLSASLLGVSIPRGFVPFQAPEWQARIHTDTAGFNYGYNAGLLFRPFDWVDIGASYTSATWVAMDGTFKLQLPTQPFTLLGLIPLQHGMRSLLSNIAGFKEVPETIKGKCKMYLVLPQSVNMGAKFKPEKHWEVDAGARWTDWSQYENLKVRFKSKNSDVALPSDNIPFKDVPTWEWSLGLTYKTVHGIRFGVNAAYEQDAVPERVSGAYNIDAPKVDALGWVNWQVTQMVDLGLGYSHVFYFDKKVDQSAIGDVGSAEGVYKVSVDRVGVNVGVVW